MKQWTALLFATMAIHAAAKQLLVYSIVSAGLFISSFAYHTSDKTSAYGRIWFWIDQACIYAMAMVAFYYMYYTKQSVTQVGLLTALLVFLLYWGGWATDSCCFDCDATDAVFSHCSMHVIGAIGHHCVIAGIEDSVPIINAVAAP